MSALFIVHGHKTSIVTRWSARLLGLAWIEVASHLFARSANVLRCPLLVVEGLTVGVAGYCCSWLKEAERNGDEADECEETHFGRLV